MKRRGLLAASASLVSPAAWGQAPERLRKVGVLIDGSAPHPLPDALRAGLAARGWVEGRTIAFDVRYAEGQQARANEQAAALVRTDVDVIAAHFTPARSVSPQRPFVIVRPTSARQLPSLEFGKPPKLQPHPKSQLQNS